jgi:D-sedoheptulose 7-phosphate isomerase
VKADLTRLISSRVEESVALQKRLLEPERRAHIARVAELMVGCLRDGGKIVLCGNGGSAADAQHIAAEFVGRYMKEREALPAIALTANSSTVTAIGNDYGFDDVFARQVRALCRPGDVVFGISTSGNSENVVRAFAAGREIGATTIGLTGESGGRMREACDECLRFPSGDTPRIQEGHALIAHILCEIVEDEFAG